MPQYVTWAKRNPGTTEAPTNKPASTYAQPGQQTPQSDAHDAAEPSNKATNDGASKADAGKQDTSSLATHDTATNPNTPTATAHTAQPTATPNAQDNTNPNGDPTFL